MADAISATPVPADSGQAGTARDLQREALHDLVLLSTECASTEEAVERRRRTRETQADAELKKTEQDITARYQADCASVTSQYEEFLRRIEDTYTSDRGKLQAAQKEKRVEQDQQHAGVETEIKKKYTQAAWLAETVLEAAQEQSRAEAKQTAKDLAERKQLVAQLDQQAQGLMYTLRQAWAPIEWPEAEQEEASAADEEDFIPGSAWPEADEAEEGESEREGEREHEPGEPAAATAVQDPKSEIRNRIEPPAPEAPFESLQAEAESRLTDIATMRLPRLVVGVAPFLITLLIMAVAAGVTQLATGAATPQFREMGLAAGVALAAAVAGYLALRTMTRGKLEHATAALHTAIERAARSAQAEYTHARWERTKRLNEAIQKREREVQEAKERFGPLLNKTVRDREEFLKAQRGERDRLVTKMDSQREAGLGEAETWRRAAQAEVDERHTRERREAAERHTAALAEAKSEYAAARAELEARWRDGLTQIQEPIGGRRGGESQAPIDWEAPAWQTWKPPHDFAAVVRFGEMKVNLQDVTERVPKSLALPETFAVPALLAFPRQASLLVASDHTGRAEAIRTLRMVMMRLLVSLPAGRVRFTIIDPVGLGQNFAGFMHLADYDEALVGSRIWTESEHIERRLADLTEHMETVIQKYLRNEFDTIDAYNAQAGELAEPYRFLVIADFPIAWTEDSLRRLAAVIGSGARCGVYTLIARDTRQQLPPGVTPEELGAGSVSLSYEKQRFTWKDEVFRRFPLSLDAPASEEFLTRTLHLIGREARESKRVEVPFTAIAPVEAQTWSRQTARDIEVPIGRMGATRLQTLRLGRGVAQHGLIAGKTGSGKSTLLHVLVTNLALWYSPEEVEFYLVDFKKGVEFKCYATYRLPHARAVAVESDREFGLSVLQRVDAELTRRGAMFRKLGVQDLAGYREASGEKLPRTLLIIDEFQEFFSEDDRIAQDASLLLDRLVRQGRAFGIHLLLGSQTIGGTSGLARSTIGQMAVRVALQTSEADSQIILGDGNSAARLLSRPGEAIYNDMSGLVEANSPFQISWLPDEQRDQCLSRVRARAEQAGIVGDEAVVFEGNVPADLRKNAALSTLIDAPTWPPVSESPQAWLGEPVAIKEATAITLRRQSGANVLVIGQQEESALALLVSSLLSLAAQNGPRAAKFYVLDGSPADSPLAKVFPRIQAAVPHEVKLVEYRAVPEAINELAQELAARQTGEDLHPPAVYLFAYGLQRYRVLRKQEDSFSFGARSEDARPEPDRQFADLLREGPPLGMHVIAWCDTPAAVERTLDRSSLREFDNRVLFQMSASDSSNLIDSPLANKLGQNRALAYSEEHGTIEKFRPYALPDGEWLEELRRNLEARSKQ